MQQLVIVFSFLSSIKLKRFIQWNNMCKFEALNSYTNQRDVRTVEQSVYSDKKRRCVRNKALISTGNPAKAPFKLLVHMPVRAGLRVQVTAFLGASHRAAAGLSLYIS